MVFPFNHLTLCSTLFYNGYLQNNRSTNSQSITQASVKKKKERHIAIPQMYLNHVILSASPLPDSTLRSQRQRPRLPTHSGSSPSTCPATAKTNLRPASTAFTNMSQGEQQCVFTGSHRRNSRQLWGVRFRRQGLLNSGLSLSSIRSQLPIPAAPNRTLVCHVS